MDINSQGTGRALKFASVQNRVSIQTQTQTRSQSHFRLECFVLLQ